MRVCTKFVAVIVCGAATTSLFGEIVEEFELGEGIYTSTAIFQFTNQNQYVFTINYDDAPSGEDIIEFIAEGQPGYFIPTIESYDFGGFLYGLTIGEDSDEGYGTPDEYLDKSMQHCPSCYAKWLLRGHAKACQQRFRQMAD